MKLIRLVFLLWLCLNLSCSGEAQKIPNSVLKLDTKVLKLEYSENDNIIEIFKDPVSKKVLRAYRNQIGFRFSSGDKYGGIKIPVFENGVLKSSGNKIKFDNAEELISFYDEELITIEKNWEEQKTILRLYKLNNLFLNIQNEVILNSTAHISYLLLKNKNILLWDENEEFGYSFAFYDSKLKELSATTPFKSGFNFLISYSENDNVTVLAKNNIEGTKVFNYNGEGVLISEKSLNLKNIRPWNLFAPKNKIVVYGLSHIKKSPSLISFAKDGEVSWEKNLVLPYHYREPNFQIDNQGINALAFTGEQKGNEESLGFTLINLENGSIIWEKKFSEIYKKKTRTDKTVNLKKGIVKSGLRPFGLEFIKDGNIFLGISRLIFLDRNDKSSYPNIENQGYIFSLKGKLLKIGNLNAFKNLKVINDSKLQFLTEKKVITYEK